MLLSEPVWFTVTVACAVTVPAELFAVSVYVVVCAGLTIVLPFGRLIEPTPLSICADVAFVVVQESALLCPGLIVAGLAESDAVGADPPELPCGAADAPPPQTVRKRNEVDREMRNTTVWGPMVCQRETVIFNPTAPLEALESCKVACASLGEVGVYFSSVMLGTAAGGERSLKPFRIRLTRFRFASNFTGSNPLN